MANGKSQIRFSKKPLLEAQGGLCHYCKVKMTNNPTSKRHMTWDHKVPSVADGDDSLDNLVLACQDCNSRKGSIPYDLFVKAEPWLMTEKQSALFKVQWAATRRGDANILYHIARYCPSCNVVMTLPSIKVAK